MEGSVVEILLSYTPRTQSEKERETQLSHLKCGGIVWREDGMIQLILILQQMVR